MLAEGQGVVPALVRLVGIALDDLHLGHPVGQAQRRLQRVGEAPLDPVPTNQPVDDHFDGVDLVASQLRRLGQLVHLAVDPGPGEALAGQLLEQALILALSAPDHGSQDLEAGAVGQLQDAIDDLLWGLTLHHGAVIGAVRYADAGVQQTQVVVYLGDGADRRPRVAGSRLLIDRNRGREALDEIDVGLVHLAEELAGVARQRLDVAALAFGVDRVESQRALSRTRQAGEDDEPIARQVYRNVAKVVLPGAPDHQLASINHLLRHPSRVPANTCSMGGFAPPV